MLPGIRRRNHLALFVLSIAVVGGAEAHRPNSTTTADTNHLHSSDYNNWLLTNTNRDSPNKYDDIRKVAKHLKLNLFSDDKEEESSSDLLGGPRRNLQATTTTTSLECNQPALTFSADELTAQLGAAVDELTEPNTFENLFLRNTFLSKIEYGVQFYQVCASCKDIPSDEEEKEETIQSFCGTERYGSNVTYSGILALPIDQSGNLLSDVTLKTVIDMHPTSTSVYPSKTLEENASSDAFVVMLLDSVAASMGQAAVLFPDYMGYGVSTGAISKGYVIQQSYETSCIPLWYKAKDLVHELSDCTLALGQAALVKGYSEGGYSAIVIADMLQKLGVDIIGVYAGGGPYQVSSVSTPSTVNSILQDTFPDGRNSILALFGASYSSTFGDLPNFGQGQDFISADMRDIIVELVTNSAIEQEIESQVFDKINSVSQAVNPEALEFFQKALDQNIDNPCVDGTPEDFNMNLLCEAFQRNDIHETILATAVYPIKLCHSPDDEVVSFANVPTTIVEDNESVSFALVSGSHNEAGLQCVLRALTDVLGTVVTSFEIPDEHFASCAAKESDGGGGGGRGKGNTLGSNNDDENNVGDGAASVSKTATSTVVLLAAASLMFMSLLPL